MNRPYVICYMVMSVDGKVTGDFLFRPEAEKATEIYYEINRRYKADAYACGRITMEESFTQKWYPDLSNYESFLSDLDLKSDFICGESDRFYAVAFDPKGKLGWKSNRITDDDPGYGGARIIEVLTQQVDARYLSYLKETQIPYIFAGETETDVSLALFKLKEFFKIETLLLEGGSVINGAFQRADTIDELSLVVCSSVAGKNSKPLFTNSEISDYELVKAKTQEGVLVLNYKRK